MRAVLHRFVDLDEMIDQMHELFHEWDRAEKFYPPLDPMDLERARLAMHEWLANLVQHAEFNGHDPDVLLVCEVQDGRLRFTIEDNSAGYDIEGRPHARRDILKVFPERGMGLDFMKKCTENLSYTELDNGRHRMEFYVAASKSHE